MLHNVSNSTLKVCSHGRNNPVGEEQSTIGTNKIDIIRIERHNDKHVRRILAPSFKKSALNTTH